MQKARMNLLPNSFRKQNTQMLHAKITVNEFFLIFFLFCFLHEGTKYTMLKNRGRFPLDLCSIPGACIPGFIAQSLCTWTQKTQALAGLYPKYP